MRLLVEVNSSTFHRENIKAVIPAKAGIQKNTLGIILPC
jgi:hypothetical protein